jgi:glycosyltransferase involved in cell wall biosynthesis
MLKIAFVSFEYHGVVTGGGIGTYIRNAAAMLSARGHHVEVFCGASDADFVDAELDGIKVHRLPSTRTSFRDDVVDVFRLRHQSVQFDLVEGAEYGADLFGIVAAIPQLARVVKLHTATFQINTFNDAYVSKWAKLRFAVGALKRGRMPKPYWGRYDKARDPERCVTIGADEVTSPSHALLTWTSESWRLSAKKCSVVPNAFVASPALLTLSPERPTKFVTFIGRLEVRKGVLELAEAIPLILAKAPETKFQFIGRTLSHPSSGVPLDVLIRKIAGSAACERIYFRGPLEYEAIASAFAETTVAVLPSYWEAFGYVCLEAMSAACGIVGTSGSGMAEILEDGRTGRLVPPRQPAAIASAVLDLINNPEQRRSMATSARRLVLARYSYEEIAPAQEASYLRALERARKRRPNERALSSSPPNLGER